MRTISTNVSVICSNSIVSEGLKSILLNKEFAIVNQHKNYEALITAQEENATDVGMIVVDADGTVTFRATDPDAATITAELAKAGA